MRVGQRMTLDKLNGPHVWLFLVRIWHAARAVLPRI
jgi:hypothetical protein